jgi:hypothetical protein
MYTVARFLVGPEQLRSLEAIGETMNAARLGVFQGPRSRGDGIALDVADNGGWNDQISIYLSVDQAGQTKA